MALTRFSARLREKNNSTSDNKSSDEQKRQQIRTMYAKDIPNVETAFIRTQPPSQMINNDEEGVIEIANVPEKIAHHNWKIRSIFFDAESVHTIDGFRTVNEDKDYRNHLQTLSDEQWPAKQTFFEECGIGGKPVKLIFWEAHNKGRIEGIEEMSILVTKQSLVYCCIKMLAQLRNAVVKRQGWKLNYDHVPLFAFETKGREILNDCSGNYIVNGTKHIFDNIVWEKLVDLVGIEHIAKKYSKNVYYYRDVRSITYEEQTHLLTMENIGVRWNGATHRHRNIPALLDE